MKKTFCLLFAAVILFGGCKDDDPLMVSSITLNKTAITLVVGVNATDTLTAIVAPDNAEDKTLTWTSSAPEVATVEDGLVTAIAKGTATITATAASGKTATCTVTSDYIVETVLIPKGSFLMGSSDGSAVGSGTPGTDPNATPREPNRDNVETQHRVTLTKDYYMSQYQITNAQYAVFLNELEVGGTGAKAGIQNGQVLIWAGNDSFLFNLRWNGSRWAPLAGFEHHPVIFVSWYGAKAYAEWAGGNLPTEAQWERAARGGIENHTFGIGTGKVLTIDMANFNGYYPYDFDQGGEYEDNDSYMTNETATVGQYAANAYGLYDMHGNVLEWCLDWWDGSNNYPSLPDTDPVCTRQGAGRIARGGSYFSNARGCRSALRLSGAPSLTNSLFGFRIVFN
jgi:formylglycine-generating enzyme required for sulfatase activity